MAHKHRKRFGQNFLHDPVLLQAIVAQMQLCASDRIIEIGPGEGALTELLVDSGVTQLDLIEIDRDLIEHLKKKFSRPNTQVHQADVLTFDLATLLKPRTKTRIVGNLPYNISTPILFRLFTFLDRIQDMHFLLQKEVVLRMAAQPGSKTYGRLSIMTQYFCDVTPGILIPPEAFTPPPKVDSYTVCLTPRQSPRYRANHFATFERIVCQAFSQRRKTIHNALKKLIDTQCFASLNIQPHLRPEQLSIEDFVKISNTATWKK